MGASRDETANAIAGDTERKAGGLRERWIAKAERLLAARREEQVAGADEGDRGDFAPEIIRDFHLFARGDIPETHAPISSAGRQHHAIGAPRDAQDMPGMPFQ